MNTSRRLVIALLACAPALAAAHPGHDAGSGLAAGLLHPLMGVDHLIAALMAGVWGAQRGGRLRYGLPGAFLAAAVAGMVLAPVAPVPSGATEQMILASLFVMGAALALAWRVPTFACVALAAGFAFFHGLAHGTERPAGAAIGYEAGLILMTAGLLAAGVLAGLAAQHRRAPSLLRWAGLAGIAGGAAMLG